MLTVCMIVRDEAEHLGKCLQSMYYTPVYDDWPADPRPIWDRLVIVDTGSVDATVEIAKSFGAEVEHFDWIDDYAAARNYAESFVTEGYIYWQDADEILLSGHEAIREIAENAEVPSVRPILVYEGQEGENPWENCRQDLLHKAGSHVWKGAVHEWTEGPLGKVDRRIRVTQIDRTIPRPNVQEDNRIPLVKALLETGLRSEHGLVYLSRECHNAGQPAEAFAFAKLALDLPKDQQYSSFFRSTAALTCGIVMRELKQYTEARNYFLRAISEHDMWAEPFYMLGTLSWQCGRHQQAKTWLTASLTHPHPEDGWYDPSIYTWRRHCMLAVVHDQLGETKEAAEQMGIALANCPESERAELAAHLERMKAAV